MKSVLISIQPKWCELIENGKKTVDVRKTKPKLETPFKCYIYETLGGEIKLSNCVKGTINRGVGKVIGEFVCKKIDRIAHCGTCNNDIYLKIVDKNLCCKELNKAYLNKCKLSYYDIDEYSNGCDVYGWQISNLVIYDKPRELSEFYTKCDEGCEDCNFWQSVRVNADEFDIECASKLYGHIPLKRPPQSWCYVESEVEGE